MRKRDPVCRTPLKNTCLSTALIASLQIKVGFSTICADLVRHDIKIIRRISLKILTPLTLILLLLSFQAAFATQERYDRQNPGDMRERRPAEDTREPRDSSNQRSTDRPWREILAKCSEMKKAGKLSRAMKEECKAARELRKKSKQ